MELRLKNKNIIYLLITILLVWRPVVERAFSWFGYADDVFAVLIFIYGAFICFRSSQIDKVECIFLAGFALFNLWGWISSFVQQLQSFRVALLACFTADKGFLVLIGMYGLVKVKGDDILAGISKYARAVLISIVIWQAVMTLLSLPYYFYVIELSALDVALVSLIFSTWRGKRDLVYIILSLVIAVYTQKAKSFAAVLLMVFLLIVVCKLNKKIRIVEALIAVAGCLILAKDKLYEYFVLGVMYKLPRASLFIVGGKYANKYFPFGSGWGTFGTYYSSISYSPLYIAEGWEDHIALGRKEAVNYMTDAYWPGVYCEAGWIGLAAVLLMVGIIVMQLFKDYKDDYRNYMAIFLSVAYLMITTIESSAFANPALTCLLTVIGAIMGLFSYRRANSE